MLSSDQTRNRTICSVHTIWAVPFSKYPNLDGIYKILGTYLKHAVLNIIVYIIYFNKYRIIPESPKIHPTSFSTQ